VVQRAGRCNRYGEVEDAHLLWKRPEDSPPYDLADLEAAEAALRELEGSALTGTELAGHDVASRPVEHLVLRRKDLLELSDTAPDLSGNTIDVGRFIRDSQDIDVRVAWRELMDGATPPSRLDDDTSAPTRDELCSAPIAAVRKLVARPRGAPLWRFADQTGRWERCLRAGDVTPGAILLADLSLGRYDNQLGWADAINKRVAPIGEVLDDPLTAVDAGPDEGGLSGIGVWVPLTDHLRHTESHALDMVHRLTDRIGPTHGVAVVRAAALHDIGKIHPVFQDTMRRSAADSERSFADSGGPWAKSSKRQIARHSRPSFSHALAGALALGDDGAGVVLEGVADVDLVRYLVAAHHGRVRLGIRSGAEDRRCPEGGSMTLGICHGEVLPEVRTPVGTLPETVLDLGSSHLGAVGSWTAMALAVRDREGMGPFRLAYLEALVRLADFRASAEEEVRA
jgi:CRISPR-associated endonuclease/helicase Cas3